MTKLDDIVAIKDFAEQSDTKVPFVFLSKKKYLIKEHLTKKSHVQDYFAFIKKNVDIYDILYILKSKSFVEYYRNGNKSIESLKAFKIDCLSNITTSGKISFFDGFDPQKIKSLYKYIPLNRFLKNLEDNELVLVSPKTWRDPYEKKYWLADYSALSFTRPNIYCMCLTQNCRKNEDAAWNLYTYNKNEKIIQIEYYTSKLLDKLSKDASIKKIYIGNAIYDFTSPEINNLYKNGKKGHFQFFNEFNEEKFINLLRVKRKSYAFENEVRRCLAKEEECIRSGKTVCCYTTRALITADTGDKEDELRLSVRISDAVQSLVGRLTVTPAFVIAKGGITSSDVGTKALAVKRANVLGQIRPGIPVWQTGEESKFPQTPYVIFPGNVGENTTLREAVEVLTAK